MKPRPRKRGILQARAGTSFPEVPAREQYFFFSKLADKDTPPATLRLESPIRTVRLPVRVCAILQPPSPG